MEAAKKKKIILFVGAGLVFTVMLYMLWGSSPKSSKTSSDGVNIFTDLPEAETEDLNESKSDIYRTKSRIERDNEKYFSGLGKAPESDTMDISLVSGSGKPEPAVKTTDDVMASLFQEPAAEPAPAPKTTSKGGGSSRKPAPKAVTEMTADEKMEFDRKRAEMMRDVLIGEETPKEEAPAEEQHISEYRNAVSRSSVISSLDDDVLESSWEDGASSEDLPVRCMFVRSEKLKSGQRVTVRLLEDYQVGGRLIPANTHLSANCTIGDRLSLKVTSVELGGQIIPLNLDAYDRDGSLGIYCPETGSTRNKNTVTNSALTTASSTIGGMVGRIAGAAINTGASVVRNATGDVTVTITSGYEFYLMKSKRR